MNQLTQRKRRGVFAAALTLAAACAPSVALPGEAYDEDCKVILCLAGGFPAGCESAFEYMMRRILSFPPKPPFGFCAMDGLAPSGADPNAPGYEDLAKLIDDEAIARTLASIRVTAAYGDPTWCHTASSSDDRTYRCTPVAVMNGDGSNLRMGRIEGWWRGAGAAYVDVFAAPRTSGNLQRYIPVGQSCRRDREGDEICADTYAWTPVATGPASPQ